MKPLIGINLDIEKGPPRQASIQANYIESVLKAGGIPVLLAPMPDEDLKSLLKQLHGVMLIGGRDYFPESYGESVAQSVKKVEPERQDFDLRLVKQAVLEEDLPVLGICAGCQLLNIGLGGTLVQDIPSEFPQSTTQHSSKNGWEQGFNKHLIKFEGESKLAKIYGVPEVNVPTSHHQSVKSLGKGLKAVAKADDNVIEAVEFEGKPFTLGVQWHPERDYEGNAKLFQAFIKQAASR